MLVCSVFSHSTWDPLSVSEDPVIQKSNAIQRMEDVPQSLQLFLSSSAGTVLKLPSLQKHVPLFEIPWHCSRLLPMLLVPQRFLAASPPSFFFFTTPGG